MVVALPDPERAVLAVRIVNPQDTSLELRGIPRLLVHSKMYGSGTAYPAMIGDGVVWSGPVTLTVR
jgi:hypothetical protein